MTRSYLLLLILAVSLFGCKKSENTSVPSRAGFIINGVTDQVVEVDTAVVLPVNILQQTGEQELVTLSVKGLPASIKAVISPERGTPAFNANVRLRTTDSTVTGDYPLQIVATSKSGTRSYDMSLKVVPMSECASRVAGDYTATEVCDQIPGSTYNTNVYPFFGNTPNRIRMSSGALSSVYADLNCHNKTLIIPRQYLQGGSNGEMWGTGYYDKKTITVNYSIYYPLAGITINCTTILQRI